MSKLTKKGLSLLLVSVLIFFGTAPSFAADPASSPKEAIVLTQDAAADGGPLSDTDAKTFTGAGSARVPFSLSSATADEDLYAVEGAWAVPIWDADGATDTLDDGDYVTATLSTNSGVTTVSRDFYVVRSASNWGEGVLFLGGLGAGVYTLEVAGTDLGVTLTVIGKDEKYVAAFGAADSYNGRIPVADADNDSDWLLDAFDDPGYGWIPNPTYCTEPSDQYTVQTDGYVYATVYAHNLTAADVTGAALRNVAGDTLATLSGAVIPGGEVRGYDGIRQYSLKLAPAAGIDLKATEGAFTLDVGFAANVAGDAVNAGIVDCVASMPVRRAIDDVYLDVSGMEQRKLKIQPVNEAVGATWGAIDITVSYDSSFSQSKSFTNVASAGGVYTVTLDPDVYYFGGGYVQVEVSNPEITGRTYDAYFEAQDVLDSSGVTNRNYVFNQSKTFTVWPERITGVSRENATFSVVDAATFNPVTGVTVARTGTNAWENTYSINGVFSSVPSPQNYYLVLGSLPIAPFQVVDSVSSGSSYHWITSDDTKLVAGEAFSFNVWLTGGSIIARDYKVEIVNRYTGTSIGAFDGLTTDNGGLRAVVASGNRSAEFTTTVPIPVGVYDVHYYGLEGTGAFYRVDPAAGYLVVTPAPAGPDIESVVATYDGNDRYVAIAGYGPTVYSGWTLAAYPMNGTVPADTPAYMWNGLRVSNTGGVLFGRASIGASMLSPGQYLLVLSDAGGNVLYAGPDYVTKAYLDGTYYVPPADDTTNTGTTGGGGGTINSDNSSTAVIVTAYFEDIVGHWAEEAIHFAVSRGLYNGVSDTQFAPDEAMSRAMVATVLARLANGAPIGVASFADVPAGQWYSNGILWAAEVNIVQGTGANQFAPNANVTREQLAVMLYNYAKYAAVTVVDASRSGFVDRASVSDWAEAAVDWAVSVNLITGKPGNLLDPQGNATRAEVATILMRFMSL